MDIAVASVRGYIETPCLLEINLRKQCLDSVNEIPCEIPETIPLVKRGFTGVQYFDQYLVAATWDRIYLLDAVTYRVREVITDRRFSDIHAIHIDGEGIIWVANTNLDGVYKIQNGEIEPFWHAWDSQASSLPDIDDIDDYRHLAKEEIPFYRLHVNAVFPTPDYVFVSFLGPEYKIGWLRKRLVKARILQERVRDGGLFVIDRRTRKVIKEFRLDGLHNSVLGKDNKLYFTEYFCNAVAILDLGKLTIERIQLQIPSYRESGYLARGILLDENGYWIGHSALRGWKEDHPTALLRSYSKNGEWTGSEIRLPGYIGIYDLIEKR